MTSPSASPTPDDLPVTDEELLAGELTAAMLETPRGKDDSLPADLAQRITAAGEALVRAQTVPPVAASVGVPAPLAGEASLSSRGDSARTSWLAWSGWLAAAALLLLFVRANSTVRDMRAEAAANVIAGGGRPVSREALLRDSLLATAGVIRRSWTPTTDSTASGATGEVLWDPATLRGVMRFVGLTANDRARWQYQLWIFDTERDERYPVDGGVFDIPSGSGEVLVPIRARIGVGKATLFAVTVEAPGGVVVSSRERIAVTAAL